MSMLTTSDITSGVPNHVFRRFKFSKIWTIPRKKRIKMKYVRKRGSVWNLGLIVWVVISVLLDFLETVSARRKVFGKKC